MRKKDYNLIAETINKTWRRKYLDYTLPPTEIREFIVALAIDICVEFSVADDELFKKKLWEIDK